MTCKLFLWLNTYSHEKRTTVDLSIHTLPIEWRMWALGVMGVGTLATGTLTRTACKRWVLWLWGELDEIIGARGLPDGDNVGGATTCIKTDIVLNLIDKKVKSESHNKLCGPCLPSNIRKTSKNSLQQSIWLSLNPPQMNYALSEEIIVYTLHVYSPLMLTINQ